MTFLQGAQRPSPQAAHNQHAVPRCHAICMQLQQTAQAVLGACPGILPLQALHTSTFLPTSPPRAALASLLHQTLPQLQPPSNKVSTPADSTNRSSHVACCTAAPPLPPWHMCTHLVHTHATPHPLRPQLLALPCAQPPPWGNPVHTHLSTAPAAPPHKPVRWSKLGEPCTPPWACLMAFQVSSAFGVP